MPSSGLSLIPTAKAFPDLRARPTDKPDDYCVMREGQRIGRILQHHGGPMDGQWSWYVHREYQVKGRPVTGTVNALEEAKAAFKAAVSE